MKVAIAGLGLIGGSMAIAIREHGFATEIIGIESRPDHAAKALQLGLVNRVLELKEAILNADLVILAVPVDAAITMLPGVLDLVDTAVVMDVGSTKSGIVKIANEHRKRKRFVASHPMWGTEYSGPEAAVHGAFVNKAAVICDREHSDENALHVVESLYRMLGMHLINMNAADHDVHVAYISHISHITSFALANTVLEKEKGEETIFELASGGFESTVRLAKSNPLTWSSIFMENRENVLDVLNEHISQLRKFKACLEKENTAYLQELMEEANKISKILK